MKFRLIESIHKIQDEIIEDTLTVVNEDYLLESPNMKVYDPLSYERQYAHVNHAYNNFDPTDITLEDIEESPTAIHTKFFIDKSPDCALYAGCIAKSLDKFNIPYKVYCGASLPDSIFKTVTDKDKERYKDKFNHCWVEANGKIYERSTGNLIHHLYQKEIPIVKEEDNK